MIAFVVALVVTAVGVAALLPILRHRQVMDVPNERSSHAQPVPRGGGLVVVLGVVSAAAVAARLGTDAPWPLLVTVIALAGVGFVDDLRGLGGGVRLGLQLLAACAVAGWAAYEYAGPEVATMVFVLVSIVAITGYVNAFNFMDGIDGISALNAMVAGFWFAYVGDQQGTDELVVAGLALAGASIGFLPWNAPRARIFLGDVGSYGIGLLIVGMAVIAWADGATLAFCVAPLVPYGADTVWALSKRAVGRRPLMTAHREHAYQRLVDLGWPHLNAAALTAAMSVACILVVWWADDHALVGLLSLAALAIAYLALPRLTYDLTGVVR